MTEAKYLAADCNVRQGKLPEALAILGEHPSQEFLYPSGQAGRPRKTHASRSAMSGLAGRAADDQTTGEAQKESNRHFEASMCYLRGICYAKQNAFDRAKESYKQAVEIDIRCFEAFDQLMRNQLLSPAEEWEFLRSLDFESISTSEDSSTMQEAGDLTKMLYTMRMSKYSNSEKFRNTIETLETHYKLGNNHDVLLAKAETLFTGCKFSEALQLTTEILEHDRYNFAALPAHLACLFELGERNALHLLAADLTERHPENPASWLAVGAYYLNIGKIAEARRFFSKSSMMDPHFGPAWIGFAHTFAAEGEHDQATAAYTTAARLFPGTHLPQLFLGMQQLQLHNLEVARQYLESARNLCPDDALVLNELGVTYYQEDKLEEAIYWFDQALTVAERTGTDSRSWLAIRTNRGNAYRRGSKLKEALADFDEVIRGGGRDVGILSTKAMILMDLSQPQQAMQTLHEALSLNKEDPIANDLMQKAMEESAQEPDMALDEDIREFDDRLLQRLNESKSRPWSRRKVKAGKQPARGDVEMEVV
jgi:anaphase-promoting complex subunit 6